MQESGFGPASLPSNPQQGRIAGGDLICQRITGRINRTNWELPLYRYETTLDSARGIDSLRQSIHFNYLPAPSISGLRFAKYPSYAPQD